MVKKYSFDPISFGFLPPEEMPKPLVGYLGAKTYVKVIATSENGSFWYKAAVSPYGDDRWVISSGLYDAKKGSGTRGDGHTSRDTYSSCITSEKFAKSLLVHLLGTTTNEGTLKWGRKRLKAKSMSIPIPEPLTVG